MSRNALSPRIVFAAILVMYLSACGPRIANTFSTISNSLPDDVPGEDLIPAAEEPPADEIQPTQMVQGGVSSTQPVIAFPTSAALPNPVGPGGQPTQQPTVNPSLPERRRLTLEFPPQIRAGDSDRVRITLEVDDFGNFTPTAEVGGNVVTGDVIEIPNLYETHNVIAEAQFDITGLQISPTGRVSQSVSPGQSVTFYWSILPSDVGIYRGTIWFFLRFVDKVSGDQSERAVSASPVEIEAVNFLGLSANPARFFGAVGSVVGTVFGIPFLEDVARFIFGGRKRVRSK